GLTREAPAATRSTERSPPAPSSCPGRGCETRHVPPGGRGVHYATIVSIGERTRTEHEETRHHVRHRWILRVLGQAGRPGPAPRHGRRAAAPRPRRRGAVPRRTLRDGEHAALDPRPGARRPAAVGRARPLP